MSDGWTELRGASEETLEFIAENNTAEIEGAMSNFVELQRKAYAFLSDYRVVRMIWNAAKSKNNELKFQTLVVWVAKMIAAGVQLKDCEAFLSDVSFYQDQLDFVNSVCGFIHEKSILLNAGQTKDDSVEEDVIMERFQRLEIRFNEVKEFLDTLEDKTKLETEKARNIGLKEKLEDTKTRFQTESRKYEELNSFVQKTWMGGVNNG